MSAGDQDNELVEPSLVSAQDLINKPKIVSLAGHRTSFGAAAFVVKSFETSTAKASLDIFVNYVDTLKTKQFTRNEFGSSSSQPVLAIDLSPGIVEDQLLFLKKGSIYSLPLGGGEGSLVATFPVPIQSFKVFQTQDQQIFMTLVLEVYADKTPAETAAQDKANTTQPCSSGLVFDKLMVRHWDNWGTYIKRNHVFVCPVNITSSGLFTLNADDAVDLMFNLQADCPGKAPGQGEEDYAISPDGSRIALSFRRTEANGEQKVDMAWSTDISVFVAELEGTVPYGHQAPLKLVSGEDWHGYNAHPSFSPDGSKLAFLSMQGPQYESDKTQVRILDLESGVISPVTVAVDLSFQTIEWSLSGSTVFYSSVQFRGINRIVRVTLENEGSVTSLVSLEVMAGDESKSSPISVPYGGAIPGVTEAVYYLETTISSPNELKLALINPSDSTSAHPVFVPFDLINVPAVEGEATLQSSHGLSRYILEIYSPSPEFTNGDIVLPRVTSHWTRGGGGDLVHLWYLPPPHLSSTAAEAAAPDASVPLLLIIHGGPQGAILNSWHYRWNLAVFAALGYGVVTVNFHGSTGYGQAFTDSIRGDWGGKPFEDNMKAVDYVLGKYKYLDASRLAALGASYGGFMVNWINGHTDRFKSLVCHDGIFSLRSLYYTTEELYFPEIEFGLPWAQGEVDNYQRWSPDSFVSEWKTPTLVIHGGVDYRVGEAEGIAAFTALQRRGVPSQFLFFPDENHWVLKPLNTIKWYATVESWLKRWLA